MDWSVGDFLVFVLSTESCAMSLSPESQCHGNNVELVQSVKFCHPM